MKNLSLMVLGLALTVSSCEVAEEFLGNEEIAKLQGDWTVDEESSIYGKKSTLAFYTVTISPDPDNDNGVIIDNFYDVGISIKANVTGTSIIIKNQKTAGNYTVYGSGTISNNSRKINFSYTVDDGSNEDDVCSAVYTKK